MVKCTVCFVVKHNGVMYIVFGGMAESDENSVFDVIE